MLEGGGLTCLLNCNCFSFVGRKHRTRSLRKLERVESNYSTLSLSEELEKASMDSFEKSPGKVNTLLWSDRVVVYLRNYKCELDNSGSDIYPVKDLHL